MQGLLCASGGRQALSSRFMSKFFVLGFHELSDSSMKAVLSRAECDEVLIDATLEAFHAVREAVPHEQWNLRDLEDLLANL